MRNSRAVTRTHTARATLARAFLLWCAICVQPDAFHYIIILCMYTRLRAANFWDEECDGLLIRKIRAHLMLIGRRGVE